MAITKTVEPYEFLARMRSGVLSGAHIKFLTTVKDGDQVLSQVDGAAMPVSLAGEVGFPLADALAAINTAALADNEVKATQITTLTADHAAAVAARDAALAERQSLADELLAYRTPVDANGVPKSVTMRQAQLALLGAHLLDTVEAAIAAMPGDAGRAAQITWAKSSAVERANPLIAALKPVLGLTDAQIDALFIAAAKL